jgi:hypothetical protein
MLYSKRSVGFAFVVIGMGVVGQALATPGSALYRQLVGSFGCWLWAPIGEDTSDWERLGPLVVGEEDVPPLADAEYPVPQLLGVVEVEPTGPATNLDSRPEIRSTLEGKTSGR